MYKLQKPGHARRDIRAERHGKVIVKGKPQTNKQRVMAEMKALGISRFGLNSMEGRYLPSIIHPDEHIGGIAYGHHEDGFAMLVATNQRIIFLDKKPLYSNEDEINYFVVSGVKYSRSTFGAIVTLHTRIRDYCIQTLNEKCALGFIKYIESHGLDK